LGSLRIDYGTREIPFVTDSGGAGEAKLRFAGYCRQDGSNDEQAKTAK
jgi:hypothetical protein